MKQDDTTARFDEQLLVAYFSGTTTAEEEQALLAWIRSSDDNRRTFAELRAVWQRGRMQRPDTQLQARFVRSLNSLNRRIDALGADAPLRRSRRIPLRRFAAAAIVAVALAAAFMTYRVATAPFVHRFHNADTVAMHVAMPDGTDVWLSPGTTLSYDDTFRIDGRNVELDGEAYFDVTHDTGQPFVVTARYRGYTHVRCKLETGRTHQIRVHLAWRNHPIVGDMVYGHKKPELGLDTQCLHAAALDFIHPRTGQPVHVECELPEYFKKALSKLEPL